MLYVGLFHVEREEQCLLKGCYVRLGTFLETLFEVMLQVGAQGYNVYIEPLIKANALAL